MMDDIMKKYMEDSKNKSIIHSNAAARAKRIDSIFGISNIILVGVTGIATNITTVVDNGDNTYGLLISGILYTSLIISGLQKYFNYGDVSETHNSASFSYSTIYKSIRDGNTDFKENIIRQFQILEALEPSIPDSLVIIFGDEPDVIVEDDSSSKQSEEIDIEDYQQNYQLEKMRDNIIS